MTKLSKLDDPSSYYEWVASYEDVYNQEKRKMNAFELVDFYDYILQKSRIPIPGSERYLEILSDLENYPVIQAHLNGVSPEQRTLTEEEKAEIQSIVDLIEEKKKMRNPLYRLTKKIVPRKKTR